MPVDDALAEYRTFAYPKARPFDEIFIKAFDKDSLLQFARENGFNQESDDRDQHTGSPGTMVTGGKMDGKSVDELRSITILRTVHLCPKVLGS